VAAPSESAAPTESAATAPGAPTGNAKEEKAKARTFLERRKLAEAIEAGERSVALDPTDAEAWLILGAAYQEKGKNAEARRAYASCVKEGKNGPRNECMNMLR
jgi:Flp pilus assembly protein TadD